RGADFLFFQTGFRHARSGRDVLLEHGEFRFDAPSLANVGILRQAVLCADDVWPQSQSFPTRAAVGSRRFGLEPVKQRQTQLFCAFEMVFGLGLADIADPSE